MPPKFAHEMLIDLHAPLRELGQVWATSAHRPRPTRETLDAWDKFLDDWLRSDLPLVLRDSRRRGERCRAASGREVIFADNSPANWVFSLALDGRIPDRRSWTSDNISAYVPLTFLTKGTAAKRDLNRAGWKVCHIEAVSDRKRQKTGDSPAARLEAEFLRFLSPSNIFLVPKVLSGAGEIAEVIDAVFAFEKVARSAD